jgi:hypothetical protein
MSGKRKPWRMLASTKTAREPTALLVFNMLAAGKLPDARPGEFVLQG